MATKNGTSGPDILHFAHHHGSNGPGFFVTHGGNIFFSEDGSAEHREFVAQVQGDLSGLSADDFGLG